MQRITMAVISVLLVGLVTACAGLGLWQTVECADDFFGLTFTLPPSASIQQERCRTAFNPDYRVVFTIDPAELSALQAAVPITEWRTDADGLLHFEMEAQRATERLVGVFGNGAISVEVVIDMGDSSLYTVYYQATFVD
jgi:hypothetical protein